MTAPPREPPMLDFMHGIRCQLREARISHDWLTVSNVEEAVYAACRKIARDAAPSPPAAQPAEPPATDDLAKRSARIATLEATVERQAREIAAMKEERKDWARTFMLDGRTSWEWENMCKRAEAERDALRECVRAADAMREFVPICYASPTDGYAPNAAAATYDAARAKVKV